MLDDTPILHHVFLLLFIMFLCIIMLYGVILMPFLSQYARFTERGRIPAARILDLKKLRQSYILCTTPNELKIYKELFGDI